MDKNNLSKKVGLLLAGCFITFNALGQTTIKGQVVDATGEPVIGASILVKDTKNGAVSDLDGTTSLTMLRMVPSWYSLIWATVPRKFL